MPGSLRLPIATVVTGFILLLLNAFQHTDAAENAKIDTESLFSFLIGTDIGEVGEKELESETRAALGKGAGFYGGLFQRLSVEYTPADNVRLEFGATGASHRIVGVPGLEDLRRGSLQSTSLELRYRFLNRDNAGVGLTVLAEPALGFNDETSGQRVDQYNSSFALLLDGQIGRGGVGVLNLAYEPQVTRDRTQGEWSRSSTFEISSGFMQRIQSSFFVGAELRYLRAYEALTLSSFSGHAVFVGPALFYRPNDDWRISAGSSTQIAGHKEPNRPSSYATSAEPRSD
jgi:hypothetical protein